MEVEENDDEELGELCAEILENWNSPIYSECHTSLHQNPFSIHHYQPLNTTYDVQRVNKKQDKTYSIVPDVPQSSLHASQPDQEVLSRNNVETKISTSKLKYEDRKQGFELEHKYNRILKALKPTNEKGYKHEEANEKSNSNTNMDQSIIPVLVADTFFDKLLGRYVDGFDIAALNKVKEAKACESEAKPSTVSANNGKRTEKLSSGQVSSLFKRYNFPTVNRMPNRSPISGEYRRMPTMSTAAPIVIRSSFQRGFVSKLRYVLPSNKTIFDINIDDFGDKMWRNPGVDISDFFNYGLDEKRWKGYCKRMQAQTRVGRFRRSKTTADKSRQLHKDEVRGKVKLDRENGECLPFGVAKDPSSYNSDVIIEIAMHDSSYKKEIRRQHIKENGVPTDDGCAYLHSSSRNTPNINCRIINGDKISPFPLDSFSAEDREWKEEQGQKYYDAHLTKSSREKKTELLITHSEVELADSNEVGKQQSSRKQEHSSSYVGQRSQKRVKFYKGNQTSHHKVDLNLVESLCSPRVDSVREKIEYYVSQGLQRECANGIVPTNSHNSDIKIEVEEDPEKLKRRNDRFKLSLANCEECSCGYINEY